VDRALAATQSRVAWRPTTLQKPRRKSGQAKRAAWASKTRLRFSAAARGSVSGYRFGAIWRRTQAAKIGVISRATGGRKSVLGIERKVRDWRKRQRCQLTEQDGEGEQPPANGPQGNGSSATEGTLGRELHAAVGSLSLFRLMKLETEAGSISRRRSGHTGASLVCHAPTVTIFRPVLSGWSGCEDCRRAFCQRPSAPLRNHFCCGRISRFRAVKATGTRFRRSATPNRL